ncbi:acyl-CoA synthetase [Citricoccus zhacaiensis]|uniref:Acyl-CoA synthetase n=1 Tax=Citricoccus zhacaiensis TaxID=489142 RepID=A0ABQ2LWE5_9MICC|nr:AMP-binding protein [Citricoccus zhacaiensis]GGO43989.1 acyl-CoA synthetase [Citricoccus zhacaiensis]
MYENYAVLWHEIALRAPDRMAVRSTGGNYTYGEFDAAAAMVAEELADRGVVSGSRVAFFLHNTAEYLVLFYACLKLEAIPVSVNYRYLGAELAGLLTVAEPVALVHASGSRAQVEDALDRLDGTAGRPELLIEIGSGLDGPDSREWAGVVRVRFEELAAPEPERAVSPRRFEPGRDAELYIFTGGTTGTPKAVVWRIGDLLHIQQSSIYGPVGRGLPADLDAAVGIAVEGGLPPVRTLPLAPFIHATALFSAMNTLALGGTVVINPDPSFRAGDVARLIVEGGVTRLIVAGDAVALPLLDALEKELDGRESSLTSVISSGMRFSDDTKRRIHALGRVAIVDILASTEGGPYAVATTTRAEDLPARFRLSEDAVVLDEAQREVQDQPGAIGVLAYRGALPVGYLHDPVTSAETYPVINGVRHCSPGDYVRVGEDGFIDLLGRGSSVVNTGGEKVFPGEVEEALLEHPAVADAVVFGVPDPRWGEAVAAVVALEPGLDVTERDLMEHLAGRVAGYKKPRTLVLRDSLDRGPTGKLNLKRLKASIREDAQ